MQHRTIPGTDISLSVVGFGCWAMGKQYWGDDVEDDVSIQAVHTALDEGINWFDTAPLYGEGHADAVLVQALGSRKKDVVIATKVGVRLDGKDGHA
ncbi:MAG: aldo/keto reductase, partial [Myxococcota bacterium]